MALFFCDGMDKWASLAEAELAYSGLADGNHAFSSTDGRFGGGAIQCTDISAEFRPLKAISFIPDGTTEWYTGFSFKSDSASGTTNGNNFVFWSVANTDNQSINGGPALTYNQLGATLGISGVNCQDGNWHWFESRVLYNGASGEFTSYIDGILDKDVTGHNFLVDVLNYIAFNPGALQSGSGNNGWIDDIIIWNNLGSTFNSFPIGPRRIGTDAPVADGATTQWTRSTGSVNADCVNGGFSSADYVYDATGGQEDLYTYDPLTWDPAEIDSVVMNYFGDNVGGSGTAIVTGRVKTGGTTASGGNITLPIGASINQQVSFDVDANSSSWTPTTVNSSQFGMED